MTDKPINSEEIKWELFNLSRWICLFMHHGVANREYTRYKGVPWTYTGSYQCKKCGCWWRNS